MYFQFLVEDQSTKILIEQLMEKLQRTITTEDIFYDIKSFHGIGHLRKTGSVKQQKTGMILNDLPQIMRGIGKALQNMDNKAAMIVVLDNYKNDPEELMIRLKKISNENMILTDHEFCVAIKEMEAWLLGDKLAIERAYPNVRKTAWKDYEQDGICDTWEVLANAVYPGGLSALKKRAAQTYATIGIAKCEWAERIGSEMNLHENRSPSFNRFINNVVKRVG